MDYVFNDKLAITFFKEKSLFEEELSPIKECNNLLEWQIKGGFKRSDYIVCHYDYTKELFFEIDNPKNTVDIHDISKGVFKDYVVTEFKTRYFKNKLTKELERLTRLDEMVKTINNIK